MFSMEANFYFHIYFRLEITAILRIQSYKGFDREIRCLDKLSDFTVKKTLMSYNSLHHRNSQIKTDMNVKIGSYTKLCTQNKILASKMQHLKQQKTSVFAPLILKRWISRSRVQTGLINIGKNVYLSFFHCPSRQLTSLFQGKQGAPKERAAGLRCLQPVCRIYAPLLRKHSPLHRDKEIMCTTDRKLSAIL